MTDIIDAMLANMKKSDPESVLDYPETVIQTVRLFYEIWKIPEGAIPNKKQKSNYSRWISELEELNKLCPSSKKMKFAMMRALKLYNESEKKSFISTPISIKDYLIGAMSDFNRVEEQKNKFLSQTLETEESKKESINKLKELLED